MSEPKKGLIARLIDMLFSGNDTEREKKRMLKSFEDQLKKRSKFYRVASHELTPQAGKFFYDIYNITTNARLLLRNVSKSEQLKSIVIESFLDDNRKQMVSQLTAENLKNRAIGRNVNELQNELKQELKAITSFLESSSVVGQINFSYAYMQAFSDFINFDYFHLLKQFDAKMMEKNPSYKPKFEAANVKFLMDDLNDFLHVAQPIPSESNWEKIFDILQNYRNTELIDRAAWRKMVDSLSELLKSETIELILRTVKEDPFYEVKVNILATDIVKPYVNRIKTQVEGYIKQLGQYEKSKAVSKILSEVFGTNNLPSYLENYNAAKSEQMFTGQDVAGYTFAEPLNALVAFAEDFLKKDIKMLIDLLILKGKWSQNIHYKDFSNAFQELLKNCDLIYKFDKAHGEEASQMMRLRNALRSSSNNKSTSNTVSGILSEINDSAKELIIDAAQYYVVIGRCLKSYIDDFKLQPKSEIIINWREIEKNTERPLGRFMVEIYTRIYYLIQMLQHYSRE